MMLSYFFAAFFSTDVLQIKALNISRIAKHIIGPYEWITAENRAENCCCQHVDRNT